MKRIAVIEDDRDICAEVSELLRDAGYRVAEICEGEDVIEAVKDAVPDLVLLDVMMPGMDGWEVLKRLRDMPETGSLKVIMLTAKRGEKDKMIGLDILKADGYVTKPFDSDELLDKVDSLLFRSIT